MSDQINVVVGDATAPAGDSPRVIVHVCNDIGGWGRGFVLAVSKRWKEPEASYRSWSTGSAMADNPPFELGQAQFVSVEPNLWVANMIGQHDVKTFDGVPPVRYEAIETALSRVGHFAVEHGASVHMPRIGCGLAGGEWESVEPLIQRTLVACDVPVYVYDLP